MSKDYFPEQEDILLRINHTVHLMEKVEKLKCLEYKPDTIPEFKRLADLELSCMPSYEFLDYNLTKSLEEARELGLADHPDVRMYSHMVGAN